MESTPTDQRAALLGHLIARHHDQIIGAPRHPRRRPVEISGLLGNHDPDLGAAFDAELRRVLGKDGLSELGEASDENQLAARITQRLADSDAQDRQVLWALAGGDDRLLEVEQLSELGPDRTSGTGRARRWRASFAWLGRRHTWLQRQFAALAMNAVVAAVIVAAAAIVRLSDADPPRYTLSVLALKTFALWCLAFLPCWLYVRFLGQRAGALWDEYVLNLHRLGWDWPRYLPRPVRTSHYYEEWAANGGRRQLQDRNIYRQKFNAYYGRAVAENVREDNFRVRLDTLFPVLLTAAVLAVCWSAVLWDDQFLRAPDDIWDVLKFGFLGAYVFIVQMLLRRFFGSDLRPSAYTSALLRIIVVLVSVAALYQVLEIWLAGNNQAGRWEAAVAFTIGFFPLVATQVLLRAVSAPLRVAMPSLKSDYPLSQLDGLNIWYEARLLEENIEDMQNLATANFVDVMLHTRVPVGRLVDWVDQAYLFLHLDRVEQGTNEAWRARQPLPTAPDAKKPGDHDHATTASEASTKGDSTPAESQALRTLVGSSVKPGSRGGTRTRTVLRQVGIRTATDLIKAFPPDQFDPFVADQELAPQSHHTARMLNDAGIDCGQLRMLVRVLGEEQGLAPVWNWYDRGVRARCPQRLPRSVRRCPVANINESTRLASSNRTNGNGAASTRPHAADPRVHAKRIPWVPYLLGPISPVFTHVVEWLLMIPRRSSPRVARARPSLTGGWFGRLVKGRPDLCIACLVEIGNPPARVRVITHRTAGECREIQLCEPPVTFLGEIRRQHDLQPRSGVLQHHWPGPFRRLPPCEPAQRTLDSRPRVRGRCLAHAGEKRLQRHRDQHQPLQLLRTAARRHHLRVGAHAGCRQRGDQVALRFGRYLAIDENVGEHRSGLIHVRLRRKSDRSLDSAASQNR
jgi:hypothetical protein